MIPKVIYSPLSGIQTYDIYLFTGAPSVPKNAVSRLEIPIDADWIRICDEFGQ